jgi:hypothetical protein
MRAPQLGSVKREQMNRDIKRVFRWANMPQESMEMALLSAQQAPQAAYECYRAIARSLE